MITGNLQHGPYEAYRLATILPLMGKHRLMAPGVADMAPLKARVNHGRWVVDCECAGAELAFEEGLFMCLKCFNLKHNHRFLPVVFPRNRQTIETELMRRAIANRNWGVGETVADLQADYEAHNGGHQ